MRLWTADLKEYSLSQTYFPFDYPPWVQTTACQRCTAQTVELWNSYCLVSYMSIWHKPHYISLKTFSIYLCYYRVSWLSSNTSQICKWSSIAQMHTQQNSLPFIVSLCSLLYLTGNYQHLHLLLGLHHYACSLRQNKLVIVFSAWCSYMAFKSSKLS